jgi:putative FmdB family regulatory protein
MPTYDYECKHCGHRFEAFQGITDKVLRKCPDCGRMKLMRLIGGGAGIIFRGSGFYATDYRGGSKPSAKAASTPAGAEAKGGGGSSSADKGSDD